MSTRTPVVLIVDDHQDSLAMYATSLISMGLNAVTAENAHEAFPLACAFLPHVIVTDVRLPGASGLDLARRLREDTRTKDAGIIAITADLSIGQRAREAGCDRLLLKPCLPDALAHEIHEVLSLRGLPGVGISEPRSHELGADEPARRQSPSSYR